jgi:hypothetical protein
VEDACRTAPGRSLSTQSTQNPKLPSSSVRPRQSRCCSFDTALSLRCRLLVTTVVAVPSRCP